MQKEIDCLGLMCPVPVVKAKIEYKKISKNDLLIIISDHSCTLKNLIDAFRKEKCNIEYEEDNGIWKIYIKKL